MPTRVYGSSDDLIDFEGDVTGEVGCYNSAEKNEGQGVLLMFSDGTVLATKYGKADMGVWQFTIISN